nr:hypothetical protein [Tanacetum cinerariifolium]
MDIENAHLVGLGTLNHVPVQKGDLQASLSVKHPTRLNDPLRCGDPLDGVFCRRCTCENGAHIVYNCTPKVSIVPNPKPCHNQNANELPKTLTNFHPTRYSGDEDSSAHDSTPNFVNDPLNIFHPPPQTLANSYEFYGNKFSLYVEDLVLIPSESEGILDNTCDVPFRDNSPPLDVSEDQFEEFSDSNDDSTSIDDNYFSINNIDYVEASPPKSELVSLEEVQDDNLHEKLMNINLLIAKIKSLNDNPNPDHVLKSFSPFPIPIEDSDSFLEKSDTSLFYSGNPIEPDQDELTSVVIFAEPRVHLRNVLTIHPTIMLDSDFIPSDNSLPESEIFYFEIKEKKSGSTTIHADISLPDLECFNFKREPEPGELTSIIDSGIRENVLSTTNVNLPPEDDHSPLFTYLLWFFLSFLMYPVVPPNLLSFGNEDTIFDPGISNYHFSSFMPGVSHRIGTFMKFNVYPNHLNESLMKILSSTTFPKDQ